VALSGCLSGRLNPRPFQDVYFASSAMRSTVETMVCICSRSATAQPTAGPFEGSRRSGRVGGWKAVTPFHSVTRTRTRRGGFTGAGACARVWKAAMPSDGCGANQFIVAAQAFTCLGAGSSQEKTPNTTPLGAAAGQPKGRLRDLEREDQKILANDRPLVRFPSGFRRSNP
jgi:hypothetical protein